MFVPPLSPLLPNTRSLCSQTFDVSTALSAALARHLARNGLSKIPVECVNSRQVGITKQIHCVVYFPEAFLNVQNQARQTFVFLRGRHLIEIFDKYSKSNPLRTSTGLFRGYVVLGEVTVSAAVYLEGC